MGWRGENREVERYKDRYTALTTAGSKNQRRHVESQSRGLVLPQRVGIMWVSKISPLGRFCGDHEADLGIPPARSEAHAMG